jgi:ribonucleoside-diphosphate reductase alpha chain
MMGAVQPFLSGAISKTVNVPKEASVEEIQQAYIDSWRWVQRPSRSIATRSEAHAAAQHVKDKEKAAAAAAVAGPTRRRLPDERNAITHKFDIAGHEGYITVGLFEDGTPGELFLVMAKKLDDLGFADAFAQAISYALQYACRCRIWSTSSATCASEPSGMTKNPTCREVDRRLHLPVDGGEVPVARAQFRAGVNNREELVTSPEQLPLDVAAAAGASATAVIASAKTSSFAAMQNQEDAPPCSTCGSIMVRSGSCYKCANCGTTSGCA